MFINHISRPKVKDRGWTSGRPGHHDGNDDKAKENEFKKIGVERTVSSKVIINFLTYMIWIL